MLKSQKHTQLLELACCRAFATAQHSATSHAQSSEERTCRSECDNASKQTELARANMTSSICSSLCSQSQRRNRNVSGQTVPAIKPQAAGDARRGYTFILFQNLNSIQHSTLFHTYLCDAYMRRPGCFPGAWSSSHLQVVSWYLIMDLCPLDSHCFVLLFPCERA